jgi:hypothetical protein
MPPGDWAQLTTALAVPYQAYREARLHIARGGPARRKPARSGGVIVTVRGARPRVVPVLARYHARLLAAAGAAGPGWSPAGPRPPART